jgi:porphobilinogen synthase
MPGVERLGIAEAVDEARSAARLGVAGVMLFGLPAEKDEHGSSAWDPEGAVQLAAGAIKQALPDLLVLTDVCLCEYTTHGHCGVVRDDGSVDNDATLELLARTAVSHTRAGADIVAPSDMMDGRVGAIRRALDAAGREGTAIMAYTAKYASAYYGPFRDAVGSAKASGTRSLDKRTYQLNPTNRREAITELNLDEAEGADIVMVKPAGLYLDIIRDLRHATNKPIAAYQVSGEYSQIHAAARLGWLDLALCRRESLLAIKRAGADMILTYFAREMAVELNG